jgi:hypothetical protein
LSPIILGLYYLIKKNIRYNTSIILCLTFFICAAGFELWLTYGLFDGLPVSERRSDALNCAIPQDLNWVLNSLGDVFIVWIGLFLVKKIFNKTINPFEKWNWSVFFVFLFWFVGQNIYVEVFIYHLQLGVSGDLSWGPLMPLGSYYNPTLFEIYGRPVTFQSQLTWVLMTPIVYFLAIYLNNKSTNQNV